MPETKRLLKVFLCYAHSDVAVVRQLFARLRREGVDVWFDEEKLLPGSDWELEIRRAVREVDVVIVCLSQQFNQMGFRQKEVRLALDTAMEQPEGTIYIIPTRLEECENLESLRKWHWVDWFTADGPHRLIRALRTRAESVGATLRARGGTRSTASDSKSSEREKVSTASINLTDAASSTLDEVKETSVALARVEKPGQKSPISPNEYTPTSSSKVLEPINPRSNNHVKDVENVEKGDQPTKQPRRKPKGRGNTLVIAVLVGLAVVCTAIASLLISPLINKWFFPTAIPTAVETIAVSQTTGTNPTPAKSATVNPASLQTEIKDAQGVSMVLVPAGNFVMGSDYGQTDEAPAHTIYLDAYYIDKYEVTNLLYKACVDANACVAPRDKSSQSRLDYYDNSKYGNFPVIYVDWSMARGYCSWRHTQLPTEAQWEKAARGVNGGPYPWGDTIDAHNANYEGNRGDTTQVGIFPKGQSPYHVYDMAGNVSEWVADWYSPTEYSSSRSNIKLASNPTGPSSGSVRVWRGGSWTSPKDGVYSFVRGFLDPTVSNAVVGFRCARDAIP